MMNKLKNMRGALPWLGLVVAIIWIAGSGGMDHRVAPAGGLPDALGRPESAVPLAAHRLAASMQTGAQSAPADMAQLQYIRRAELVVEVTDADSAAAAFRDMVTGIGGWVEQMTVQRGDEGDAGSVHFVVRVPEERLNDIVDRGLQLGKVERASTTAEEVSDQIIDLEARLRSARRLEDRLLRILDERTGQLNEVLSVERELARVRNQAESLDARLRRMENAVTWSTLQVTLHEPSPLISRRPGGVLLRLRLAWAQAVDNLVSFVVVSIALVGFLLPISIIAVLGFAAWRRLGSYSLRTNREKKSTIV